MNRVTIALSAFLMIVNVSKTNAQDTTSTKNKSFKTWLIKTPWILNYGADIISDNQAKVINNPLKYTCYPAKFAAEKTLKKGWSLQFDFASTSLNPHNYACFDLNAKYDLNNVIGETKWFDPYGILGLGYTYRDHKKGSVQAYASPNDKASNQVNFNAGLGANFWLFPNMGLNVQGLAKLGSDSYIQASLGLVFKIGNCQAPKCETTPKTQEAQDALQHLRGIINK